MQLNVITSVTKSWISLVIEVTPGTIQRVDSMLSCYHFQCSVTKLITNFHCSVITLISNFQRSVVTIFKTFIASFLRNWLDSKLLITESINVMLDWWKWWEWLPECFHRCNRNSSQQMEYTELERDHQNRIPTLITQGAGLSFNKWNTVTKQRDNRIPTLVYFTGTGLVPPGSPTHQNCDSWHV